VGWAPHQVPAREVMILATLKPLLIKYFKCSIKLVIEKHAKKFNTFYKRNIGVIDRDQNGRIRVPLTPRKNNAFRFRGGDF